MDKKIQNSSVFLDKVSQLHRYVQLTDKREYYEIKNEYCKEGKEGLFRIFTNKKKRQIAIQEASQEGDIQILRKWGQYHDERQNDINFMKRDIRENWIQCIINNENKRSLEWWHENQREILSIHISDIQIEACRKGNLYVLDWCKKNDIEWEMLALENLPNNKTLKILDWWYENKQWTRLMYREEVIDKLCQYCEIEQLQWFHDMRNKIEIKYSTKAIENTCRQGNISVLNWWYDVQDDVKMKYDEKAIEQACKNKKDDIILWWMQRPELELKYNQKNQFVYQYINILRQDRYKESEIEEICQICHEKLKKKQVFECFKCKKQLHKDCYKQLRDKNIKQCPNCKSKFFI